MQKGLDIKPLQLCSVDDSEHFREGYTAYIIHHPGRGYGPVSMARSSNSCIIISFKGNLYTRVSGNLQVWDLNSIII